MRRLSRSRERTFCLAGGCQARLRKMMGAWYCIDERVRVVPVLIAYIKGIRLFSNMPGSTHLHQHTSTKHTSVNTLRSAHLDQRTSTNAPRSTHLGQRTSISTLRSAHSDQHTPISTLRSAHSDQHTPTNTFRPKPNPRLCDCN
jgi:hypothetical protein